MNYSTALMAIAGADGELAAKELQWFFDEQELIFVDPKDYIETLRKADWRNANLKELLSGIYYDFPLNFRRAMLYQAIKMSRADGKYHEREKAAIGKAAETLGIERHIVAALESIAGME